MNRRVWSPFIVISLFLILSVSPGYSNPIGTPIPNIVDNSLYPKQEEPAADIPTPTFPIPTPTQTPTLTHSNDGIISFDGNDLTENLLVANAPAGFTLGKVTFGTIPSGEETNGRGMEIRLAPGQGAFIVSNEQFDAPSLSHISGVYKASSSDLTMALIALNSPIDGQIGYTNIAGEEVPVADYRQLNLYYAPPSGKVQLGIQAVNSPFATITGTLWVDNLKIIPFAPMQTIGSSERVTTEVEGSFEEGLGNIITNFNDMDGMVTPFFESLSDIAIRLAITPDQTAANIGTLITGVESSFPMTLLGDVSVFRDSNPGGGMIGFVMTNGFQNTALFRYVDELPGMKSILQEHLIIGSDFTINNPNIPIHVVVQNGGPGAESSVVIDDLQVLSYGATKNPTLTPFPVHIPTGPSASASSELRGKQYAYYAIDGNFSTFWMADTGTGVGDKSINDPEWWQYDFGEGNEKAVRQIRMYQMSTSDSNPLSNTAETVTIFYGDEVGYFLPAGTASSLGVGLNTINIDNVGVHRIWRIHTEDSNNSWGVSEFEFDFY